MDFDYGRAPILRGVDFSLEPGERAAIVGRNGTGKTTLFRILTGDLKADRGSVDRPRRMRVAWLRQDTSLSQGDTLFDAVRGRQTELIALEKELEDLLVELERAGQGAEHDRLTARYGRAQTTFEALGGYDLDSKVEKVLSGLGFGHSDLARPLAEFSGGEQRVAALASVLIRKADLMLLDEPTNHLDLPAILWLEKHLAAEKCAMLLISHDRTFLDHLSTTTWHLKDARLRRYAGNYSFFVRERAERERQDLIAWERQQEEIARLKDYIARNIVGQKTKQAQSRRKQLGKIVRIDKPSNERTLNIRLEARQRGGKTFVTAEGLSKAFDGKLLFSDFNLHIERGERIGLIGPNGAGKSTLAQILTGQLAPDTGQVKLGKDVEIGFFDQHLDLASDENTVAEEFLTVDPIMPELVMRTELARFGFFADDLDKKVRQLSGGERNRLSLLKLVYEGHNLLVLDEPTNHLDIPATESLEEALCAYDGTLIVISHDRSFLGGIADRIIEVADGKVADYPGSWDEFSAKQESKPKPTEEQREAPREKPRKPKDGWSKNRLARAQKRLAEVEDKIAACEKEMKEVEAVLAAPQEVGADEITRLTYRHRDLLIDLKRYETRWEAIAAEIEERSQ